MPREIKKNRVGHKLLTALLFLGLGSCNPLGSSSITGGNGPVPSLTSATASNANPIPVTISWSASVTGLDISDLVIGNGTAQNFSGSGASYAFEIVPGVEGPCTITIGDGAAVDAAGNDSENTVLTVNYDLTGPDVTVDRGGSQDEATDTLPIVFTVVFSEPIDDSTFTTADITQSGTATGVTWTITNSGDDTTYTLRATAISGIVGSLTPSIAATNVDDIAGNSNNVSTSTTPTAYYMPGYTGIQLWLRADSLSQANGSNVTSWPDTSSLANDVAEATNPPTFSTAAVNGLPAVTFNGSDILKSGSNSGMTGNPDFTIFVVARVNSAAGNYPTFIQIGETTADGQSGWFGLEGVTNKVFTGFYNGGSQSLSNFNAAFSVYTWVRDSSGGSNAAQSGNTQFWNNASESVATSLSNPAVSLTNGLFRIGRSTNNATINADIAEIILFNGTAMGGAARTQIEDYLDAKYNLY